MNIQEILAQINCYTLSEIYNVLPPKLISSYFLFCNAYLRILLIVVRADHIFIEKAQVKISNVGKSQMFMIDLNNFMVFTVILQGM